MRLMVLGGLMAVGLTAMGVQKVNHSINYVPVMASITSVDAPSCYLKSVEHGLFTRTTRTTEKMSCEEADDLRLNHPEYQGMEAMGFMKVHFTYISPVDQQQHEGTMTYAHDDYGPLATAYAGSELPILAHKSDANGTAHDYDRMQIYATPPAPKAETPDV